MRDDLSADERRRRQLPIELRSFAICDGAAGRAVRQSAVPGEYATVFGRAAGHDAIAIATGEIAERLCGKLIAVDHRSPLHSRLMLNFALSFIFIQIRLADSDAARPSQESLMQDLLTIDFLQADIVEILANRIKVVAIDE